MKRRGRVRLRNVFTAVIAGLVLGLIVAPAAPAFQNLNPDNLTAITNSHAEALATVNAQESHGLISQSPANEYLVLPSAVAALTKGLANNNGIINGFADLGHAEDLVGLNYSANADKTMTRAVPEVAYPIIGNVLATVLANPADETLSATSAVCQNPLTIRATNLDRPSPEVDTLVICPNVAVAVNRSNLDATNADQAFQAHQRLASGVLGHVILPTATTSNQSNRSGNTAGQAVNLG